MDQTAKDVYGCPDCLLIPQWWEHHRYPRLARAEQEGREVWSLQSGELTVGGVTYPMFSDYFPCDVHLAIIHTSV